MTELKKIPKIYFIILISMGSVIAVLCSMYFATKHKQESQNEPLEFINIEAKILSQDLYNLTEIRDALERFKLDNGHYPISKGFDGIYSNYGESKVDWIEGLTPTYIDVLPRDSRLSDSKNHQYYYRSDGANFKLIAHAPRDCMKVKLEYPAVIDPIRDCWAYGFWSGKHGALW